MTPAIATTAPPKDHSLPLAATESPPAHGPGERAVVWTTTFLGVVLPFLGVVAAGVLLWGRGLGGVDLALLGGMFFTTMLGITVGFHRLFTHRSFEAARPVQFALAVLGSMAFQGRLSEWVGRHRRHHQHSDGAGDPHSPHGSAGGVLRGLWHAHIGWAFTPDEPGLGRYAPDIVKSRLLRVASELFPLWAVLGLLFPAAVGWAAGGAIGAVTGFIWGGLVRVFLVHHLTWSINSVCHLWGSRPHDSGDESRNNVVMGVLALGEGWHNNHHAFPTSARHGLRWWQLDISYIVIRGLVACGLAWNVKLPAAGR